MSRVTRSKSVRTSARTGSARAQLQPVVVKVVEGPGVGLQHRHEGGLLVIGGRKEADFVLPDSTVSGQHLSLELLPGKARLRDLGSRNGTRYLGARITDALVPLGARVQLGKTTLELQAAEGATVAASEHSRLGELLGPSRAMRRVFAFLERTAQVDGSVLLEGETGTGKALAARTLHALSPRAGRPCVSLACGALGHDLAESQLFGHVKGAFTGAHRDARGAAAEAEDGVLVLEGVHDLPLELQPKLLRLLDAKELRPLGADRPVPFRARVIATSQVSLEALSQRGGFRTDLYYRLSAFHCELPPLRERPEDVLPLAEHFARAASGRSVDLSPVTIAALRCDPWPGNVRELRNLVERTLAFQSPPPPRAVRRGTPTALSLKRARAQLLERFERDFLTTLLAAHGGNVSSAAREAGISRMTLYRLCKRYELSP